jgi:hypothetical protein
MRRLKLTLSPRKVELMDKCEFELKRQRGETINIAVSRLSKWVPLCFIAYMTYLSIAALAGKTTLAQFGMWLVTDLKATKAFSHIVTTLFGTVGVSYGIGERKLRRRNVERMGNRIQELEKIIDPTRSSSRLTSRGSTRREDAI